MIFINYTKLIVWSTIYYFQKDKSEIIFEIINKNIKECGCVAIKFTQWILPKLEIIYNIDNEDPKYEWFFNLERLYEDCDHHDIKHTEKVYKEDFGIDLSKDFIIKKVIASGSIGQVYHVKDRYNNDDYAMKVLHPNINKQLFFIETMLNLVYSIPFIKQYISYNLPIKILDFINDFKIQTNLVQEGNNCLHFGRIYKDNEYFIIPKVFQMSKNILLMSYEEGVQFDKLDCTEYTKWKIMMMAKLFIKNNQFTHKLMHGDLHKANWKIREDKNGVNKDSSLKLVFYDYGLCWRMPPYLGDVKNLLFIDRSFTSPVRDINNFAKSCCYLMNNSTEKEILNIIDRIRDEYLKRKEVNGGDFDYDDPRFLIDVIVKACQTGGFLIDSFMLQSIVVHVQVTEGFKRYDIIRKNRESNYYNKQVLDIINICDTYNICPYMADILKEEYKELNIKKNNLFESIEQDNKFSNYNVLKELAIS